MSIPTQKTRFVCVSDTHNASPKDGSFKLPPGDVLIHAGDLTKQGTFEEFKATLQWIEEADYEVKLVVAGNHDVTLDSAFYSENGLYFHNQNPQDSQACIELVKSFKTIKYLNHESVEIRLKRADGPRTTFTVFGSPLSPRHGFWAFGYEPEAARALWDQIPLDTDIVITHTPPKYHCDHKMTRSNMGCEPLREILWRVRPALSICGHIHEARGAERILWDLEAPNIKYKELSTIQWQDPGENNKKQSLLDLTAKSGNPLQTLASGGRFKISDDHTLHSETSSTRGQGGIETSARSDKDALTDRKKRKETCVINAAIMASSWPYKAKMGRKHNKPIIVDLDLPVWS